MTMGSLKEIRVTVEMISEYAPGDPWNNPIAAAIKEDAAPDAREILVTADEIYIDGQLVTPTLQTTRWINDWNAGRKVAPSILGYRTGL